MQASIRKTGLLILAIVLLPVIIFSIFEIGRVRQNEKVIQDIYRNQLDAILFSINQYSDDVLSNLANRVENGMLKDTADVNSIILESPSLETLVQFRNKSDVFKITPGDALNHSEIEAIQRELKNSDSLLTRLGTYFRGGYRKIETIFTPQNDEQWIIFLTKYDSSSILVNLLILNPEKFINQTLDPKIQEISRDKFFIAAFRSGENSPFYSSSKQISAGNISERRPFWLFRNYEMGIELRGMTIAELADSRSRKNVVVVIIMDLILIAGAWVIFRNIRKQLKLSQLKSDFVSNVSHEIRTPLALVSMYVETLEMGRIKTPEKIREYYNVILNETSRLSAMVNRILNFSQIEDNRKKYNPVTCHVNEIVDKACSGFRYSLDAQGFQFSCEPAANVPDIVADREAVTDAVINLIDNAMKYSRDNKEIIVRTGADSESVWIEVEDHGIGISAENQKYIFDKFFRVTEKNLANKIKGSGLGLAIVKHIMNAHHGNITVKSSSGFGSTFRLSFPVKKT